MTTANIDTKLEVVVIPVSDVDRAKSFYLSLGWRLDADFTFSEDARAVQVTPPGSQASIIFGKGVTTAAPGSMQGIMLVVDDVAIARAQLAGHGAPVSDVFHDGLFFGGVPRAPGPDPEHRSYSSFVSFTDPDGNGWLVQEVKERLPGRITPSKPHADDMHAFAELLREAESRHGVFSVGAPKHHWSDFYAAYIIAKEHGRSPAEAAQDAALAVRAGLAA